MPNAKPEYFSASIPKTQTLSDAPCRSPLLRSSQSGCRHGNPAPAIDALDVHFRRWFCKREVGRTKPHSQFAFEKYSQKILDHPFQFGKTRMLIDQQPFHLMEHRAVGQVRITAIDPAGQIIRNGGSWLSITRTCTGDVCVRNTVCHPHRTCRAWHARDGEPEYSAPRSYDNRPRSPVLQPHQSQST